MSKYRYGLASFKIDDINPADGTAAGTPVELKDDVYRDTFDIVEAEGTTTDHFAEMAVVPNISFTEKGTTSITLQIMNTAVDSLALLAGGEVVTDGTSGDKTWSEPDVYQAIEKYLELETQDGYKVIVPRAKISARKNFQIRRNNIWLLDVTITPLKPEFEGLAAFDMIEPGTP